MGSFEWLVQGENVVEFVHAAGHSKKTGRAYESDIVRVWTVEAGKVVKVRSFYDTLVYARAIQ